MICPVFSREATALRCWWRQPTLSTHAWQRTTAPPHDPLCGGGSRQAPPFPSPYRLRFFVLYWFALAGPCFVLIIACACYWRARFLDLKHKMIVDPTEIVLITDYKAPTKTRGSIQLPASVYVLLAALVFVSSKPRLC